MTTRRRILSCVAIAFAAVGLFAGEAVFAGKPPSLKLTMSVSPTSILEGSTATGTVTHNNSSISSPVTVTLSSNDTTEATVAATVTIPAGTNTVNFAVTAINDNTVDGPQSVTITASATSYASGSANLTVNDVPTFQYVLTIPQLPADATGGVQVNDLNNLGQVVGWYVVAEGRKGYLYDPSIGVIDLGTLDLPGIPAGYQISSAVGINDHQVIVGYLTNDGGGWGDRIAFAMDWATENPVVDLLPHMGSTFTYGAKINENGDILGVYNNEVGVSMAYLYNPGLYNGDPVSRTLRDGQAIDLSNGTTSPLPDSNSGFGAQFFTLNNPVGDRPAQVAGTDPNGIAFRYTTGSHPIYETFPEIEMSGYVSGINDTGTFCGTLQGSTSVKGKRQRTLQPFRCNLVVEALPDALNSSVAGINNSGDLAAFKGIYRDDWGWRPARDLPVVGQEGDMVLWSASSYARDLVCISDRVTPDDVGFIAGRISNGSNNVLFLLTPVPVP